MSQRLVGYGVSQVPTNGMLGGMAYQDPTNVSVGNISASSYDNGLWTSEKTFNVQFPSGTSNQKVQIYWPTGSRLQGGYEVTIATGYEYASASGMLRKTFGIHAAENGGLYVQRTTVSFALGNIASWFTISDIQWDSTNSRWYIIIANLAGTTSGSSVNSGNTVTITVKSHLVAYNNSVWLNARASAASISSIYSTDTTVYPILSAPITDNSGNFIIGAGTSTGTVTQPLQVTGGGYFSGSVGIGITNPGAKLHVAAGNIKVDSGYGIDFSATANSSGTMTSELLSDYEEGTWTPVPNGVTIVSGSPTYTGTYTRIGRAVHVSMFQTAGTITVAAGNYFTGLPFTPANYHNTGSWSCAATGKSGVTNVFTNSAIYIQQIISTGTSLTQFMTSAMYIV